MKETSNLPSEFRFKKKFGQNFLRDTNLLRAIVSDAKVASDDNVLEIGAGAGALTEQIAAACPEGKLVSVEIDNTLREFLTDKFADKPNVEIVFGDILKIDPVDIAAKFNNQPFRVVANLPYYISSPIIFYLIESGLKIKSITVMLQKELVDRITATPGGKDYGAISVVLALYGVATKTRDVPRQLFTPMPNVDSAILHLDIVDTDLPIRDIARIVKICFAHRRKTLANNLMVGLNIPRETANSVLAQCGLPPEIRAERLDKQQYIDLTKVISEIMPF